MKKSIPKGGSDLEDTEDDDDDSIPDDFDVSDDEDLADDDLEAETGEELSETFGEDADESGDALDMIDIHSEGSGTESESESESTDGERGTLCCRIDAAWEGDWERLVR